MFRCPNVPLIAAAALVVLGAGLPSVGIAQAAPLPVAQVPLFTTSQVPPLNMLVMGKEHKNYYEAYNDASDLNGDGQLDVGYKPNSIEYFGYFNSRVCYNWSSANNRFEPASAATGTNRKQCSGQWSGDFLNYLTTSRMDALRKVLYGGFRAQDTATETTLQGAFLPQDAHSWGKEYRGSAIEGYNISAYAPLAEPTIGRAHLFAVTTTTGNDLTFATGYEAPLLRVMQNSPFRVWNWLSIEGPVAGNRCFNTLNQRVDCLAGGLLPPHPGHPLNRAELDVMETNFATLPNQMGAVRNRDNVDCGGPNCNENQTDPDEDYLTIAVGRLQTTATGRGVYQFRVDGDDAIDFELRSGSPSGPVVATAGCYGSRGFGACGGAELSAQVVLNDNTTYWFKFRQEEMNGGDGYRLEWRKVALPDSGASNVFDWRRLNTNENRNNGFTPLGNAIEFRFYNLRPTLSLATRDDYRVRVQACPAGAAAATLREDTCKRYPNDTWKPTGLLHDFGETGRMFFGLLTGSQNNNLEGGVLRRNISNFAQEVDANTGQFLTSVNGIARTLDRFRMIGGGYGGSVTNNLTSDANWAWGNGTGNCPSVGNRAQVNGECRMWGNPIGEMMFESMRYFAGAGAPTTRFAAGGSSQGTTEETTMGLPRATWANPYGPTLPLGLGFPECSVPVQTVISDINPSFDSDLPGSPFTLALTEVTPAPPASIGGFNLATLGQEIWNLEFGAGSRSVFIGDVGNTTDDAPTAKSASSLGNIRGLAPEEPGKQGSFSSAAVARFGFRTDINAATDEQNLRTFAVALSSPLPRIRFPVGTGANAPVITMIPFAKTVSGTFGEGAKKPTNTIVDFYVEEIVNLPGQAFNSTVNGGRPYAVFRINYEDVEQGNDHDMDAIVRYEVLANADNTVTIRLNSEYAAGSANQNMGYVLSGTTQDGVYLEVRDRDAPTNAHPGNANGWRPYALNTPPGRAPGFCAGVGTLECGLLPLTAERTFTAAAAGTGAAQLQDPLWFAAKYGGLRDSNANGNPDVLTEWDSNNDGVPDNYFLVTNALTLRAQLARAFLDIERLAAPSGGINVSGVRVDAGAISFIPSYVLGDWTGDLEAFRIRPDGGLGARAWSASQRLPAPAARNLVAALSAGPATGVSVTPPATNLAAVPFTASGLGVNAATLLGVTPAELAAYTPRSMADAISYLRGDGSFEVDALGTPGRSFRTRPNSKIGDIISSEPELFDPRSDFGYGVVNGAIAGSGVPYTTFLTSKRNATPTIFVGANAGILHGFDARDGSTGGTEVMGFIPNSALRNMGRLVNPTYTHQYYVDGSMRIGDAFIGGAWRSVLVGSVGAGGRSVFGLDVSNPGTFASTNVLWELTSEFDPDIGTAIGRPAIALLPGNRWVAIFGNGVNSANNRAMLFVVDLQTGAILRKIDTGFGAPAQTNGMTNVVVTDGDRNGVADTVYGGDFQGNLWKFSLGDSSPANWRSAYPTGGGAAVPLFVARDPVGVRQPITGSINLSTGPLPGTQLLFFGTGSYFLNNDNLVPANPQVQSVYAIYDNNTPVPDPATGRTTTLVQQRIESQQGTGNTRSRTTTSLPVDFTSQRGWLLDLAIRPTAGGVIAGEGERFLGRPLVSAGRVFFPTFRPTGGVCKPGGENWLLGLNALSGANELSSVEIGTISGTNPCTGGNCGGIFLIQGPPVRSLAVVIPQAACTPGLDIGCPPPAPLVCNAGDPTCNPGELNAVAPSRCSLVVVPPSPVVSGIVLPRPCGRVSWRQLQ